MKFTQTVHALLLTSLLAGTALVYGQGQPAWVNQPLAPTGRALVRAVAETQAADLVLLNSGLDSGLRAGMQCAIVRDKRLIASIILIKSQPDRAAALIVELEEGQSIQPGDLATLQAQR